MANDTDLVYGLLSKGGDFSVPQISVELGMKPTKIQVALDILRANGKVAAYPDEAGIVWGLRRLSLRRTKR